MTENDYRPTGRDLGIRLYGLLCWWWLRSPGNNQNNAANVNNDGSVNHNGNNVNNDNDAVRPALLSCGLKHLRKHAEPVPRAKESDSLSIFSGKHMSAEDVTQVRFTFLWLGSCCARRLLSPADERRI